MIEKDGKIYFTYEEACEILGYKSKGTLSKKLQEIDAETVRDGKQTLIPYETLIKLGASKEKLDSYIQQKEQEANQAFGNFDDKEIEEILKELDAKSSSNFTVSPPALSTRPDVVSLSSSTKSKPESKSTKEEKVKASKESIKPVEQLLGKSYAEVLKPTLESLEWWNTAKELISWYAIMIALQVAKVEPQEIIRKAEEFQDPVKFANYIRDLLSAMVEAIEDAQAIQQYREELEDAYARLKAYKVTIELQNRKIIELQNEVQTLLALLKHANEDLWMGYVMAKGIVSSMVGGVEVGGSSSGAGEEVS